MHMMLLLASLFFGSILLLLFSIGSFSSFCTRSQTFKAAVRAVAHKNMLPGTWLNDLIGDFLRDTGTAPEGILWRTYTLLEVYIPPSDYILALKLFAGRPKDREDISSLCQQLKIRTRTQAQRLVDRYIPNKQVQQLNHLDDTLDEIFP